MFNARELMDPVFAVRTRNKGRQSFQMALKQQPKYAMNWADPFRPGDSIPQHMKDAMIQSINSDGAHYTFPVGALELREELAKRVKRVNGLDVDPAKNIIVCCGSDNAFLFTIRPFMVPGECNEVLTPVPSYGHNNTIPELCGGKTVLVPTYPENGFELDIEEFEKRVTPKTKIVLITNPNNPTSTVYKRESLEKLAEFCIRHNLICLVDQCFEDSVFDGHEMVNIMTMPGMFERTILMGSLSKGMGVCGFRIGYVVASDDIIDMLTACTVELLGAPNTVAQAGVVAGLRDYGFVEEYRQEFMARAKLLGDILDTIPHIKYQKPQAGFIFWIDASYYGSSAEVMEYLCTEASVLVSAGYDYGEYTLARGYIRIIFGALPEREQCIDAFLRIKEAFLRHPKNQ